MASEQLKISAEADKESIFLYEETGKYSECQTGWGSPNLKTTDITVAYVLIKGPGMTEPVNINLYPNFPNDTHTGFEILAGDLGLKKITSGIWEIEYNAEYLPPNGENEHLQVKCTFFFDELAKCCVESALKSADLTDSESERTKNAIRISKLYQNATWAAENGQIKQAGKIIDQVTLLCDCCL